MRYWDISTIVPLLVRESMTSVATHGDTTMKSQLYQKDFLRWTEERAALLRAGRVSEAGIENIVEEIEDRGKEQKVALQSLFRQILIHLLKLDLSSATAPRAAWIEELSELRAQAETRFEQTPSLKHYAGDLFLRAWPQARRSATKSFEAYGERIEIQAECPYTIDQEVDINFMPRAKTGLAYNR